MGTDLDVRRRGIAVRHLVACAVISGIFFGAVATLCMYPSGGRHALVLGALVACVACAANALVIYLIVVAAERRARPPAHRALPDDILMTRAFADGADVMRLRYRTALEAQVIIEDLNGALNSRIVIEQAQGIVGEREALNMDQASSKLRDHARNHSLRLVDVASDVIAGTRTASALDRPPTTKPSRGRHTPYEGP